MDLNGDGQLSLQELNLINSKVTSQQDKLKINNFYDQVHKNKEGKIEFKEFLKCVKNQVELYSENFVIKENKF